MITIELEDRKAQAGLAALGELLADLTPVMEEMGEFLVSSVEARIDAGVTPEGEAFAPRSQTTLDKYAKEGASFGGVLRKDGFLRNSIAHLPGPFSLEVGTNVVQGAVMQFGAEQGAFGAFIGKDKRGRDHFHSIPWGDIPARPYLGLSETDRPGLLDIVNEQLRAASLP